MARVTLEEDVLDMLLADGVIDDAQRASAQERLKAKWAVEDQLLDWANAEAEERWDQLPRWKRALFTVTHIEGKIGWCRRNRKYLPM